MEWIRTYDDNLLEKSKSLLMKKEKHTEPIQDPDPFDGLKAIGCLFAGIVIIAAFISVAGFIINQIR